MIPSLDRPLMTKNTNALLPAAPRPDSFVESAIRLGAGISSAPDAARLLLNRLIGFYATHRS
jgi:hypothetical protein